MAIDESQVAVDLLASFTGEGSCPLCGNREPKCSHVLWAESRMTEEAPRQTRPSAVVERPQPDDAIKDCSTAELLTEVLERAKKRRAAVMAPTEEASEPPWPLSPYLVARELSLAITAAEDCLTRHNKAVYMERGVFAITDAEVVPGEERGTFS